MAWCGDHDPLEACDRCYAIHLVQLANYPRWDAQEFVDSTVCPEGHPWSGEAIVGANGEVSRVCTNGVWVMGGEPSWLRR